MGVVIVLLYSVLAVRLYMLQIKNFDKYKVLSEENRLRMLPVYAPRGHIYDRNNKLLVDNVASFNLYAIPFDARKNLSVINKIDSLYGLKDPDKLKERVKYAAWYNPIQLKKNIGIDVVSYILENQKEFPGITIETEPLRRYIYDEIGSHILGYVSEVDENKVETDPKYEKGDDIGKYGIEKYYENYLKGEKGAEYVEVTAKGKIIKSLEESKIEPKAGKDIHLTIDFDLQSFIEKEFPEEYYGTVIVLDCRNGGILSMISKPGFNPNEFVRGMSSERWKILSQLPHVFRNAAVQLTYPPGSTFKLFTGLVGLQENKITETTRFQPCVGHYTYRGHRYNCWKSSGHGTTNLIEAIAQSCNVYFYQLGERLNLENIHYYGNLSNFGLQTGIDYPDEKPGLVPNEKWYDTTYGSRNWGGGVRLNLAIGQGEISVTVLQIANFYAAMANGGEYYTPHLMNRVTVHNGDIIKEFTPQKKKIPFNKKDLDIVRKGLKKVVNWHGGTAYRSRSKYVEIAGKTGTAENPHGEDHAWFASFAPADDPEIVVVAMFEHGGHGGTISAPLAKKIYEYYFKYSEQENESSSDSLNVD